MNTKNNDLSAKAETYLLQLENGNIKSNAVKVLNHIKTNVPRDTNTIRAELRLTHQTLTATLSNLLDMGLIKIIGKKRREDSVYSIFQYVSSAGERLELRKARKRKKYEGLVKRLKTEFKEFLNGDFEVEEVSEDLVTDEKVLRKMYDKGLITDNELEGGISEERYDLFIAGVDLIDGVEKTANAHLKAYMSKLGYQNADQTHVKGQIRRLEKLLKKRG